MDDGNARALSNDTAQWDADYVVEENVVDGAALEWRGASALFAGYVAQLSLQHNSIAEVGYTGISLGWGWGRVLSFARDNHVRHNRLSGVMRALNDGGCIYTLGPQPGSTVHGNYCALDEAPVVGGGVEFGLGSDPNPNPNPSPNPSPSPSPNPNPNEAPVVGCFYHDNGSRGFVTTDNVADASPAGAPCVYLQGK